MLKAEIDYIIHYSTEVPKFVTVYRPVLPWELWCTRKHSQYGKLQLVESLCYGSEDTKKFSEGISIVVNSYTEAKEITLNLAQKLGLICGEFHHESENHGHR